MQKNPYAEKCKLAILNKIGIHPKAIDKDKYVYQLINGNRIMIKYSKFHEQGENYFFGIRKVKFDELLSQKNHLKKNICFIIITLQYQNRKR